MFQGRSRELDDGPPCEWYRERRDKGIYLVYRGSHGFPTRHFTWSWQSPHQLFLHLIQASYDLQMGTEKC
jgi:hypothetical protein